MYKSGVIYNKSGKLWEFSGMFRGINALSIDGKGRLAMPARYREALMQESAALVITIDTEETCLLLYPTLHWQVIEDNLQRLPSFHASSRRIQRLLIGHATDVDLDMQGRILLPALLREYAQLDKHVVMIGQGNKFELWNEEIWNAKRREWLVLESMKTEILPEEMKTFSL